MTSVEINYSDCLRSCMQQVVDIRKTMPMPDGFHYTCSEDMVLQYGREFTPSPLEEPYLKDTPKQCFFNSFKLASFFPNLLYVEGFCLINELPIPIHHAWCIDKNDPDKVIDVTADMKSYIGIPFKRAILRMNWKTGSLLDDWQGGWKLLRTSPDNLKKRYLYNRLSNIGRSHMCF